jgi:hypothetical protein
MLDQPGYLYSLTETAHGDAKSGIINLSKRFDYAFR